MGKAAKNACFLFHLFMRLHAVELVLLRWKLSTRWPKTAHATIDLRSRHRITPWPTRFVLGKANECRWRHRRYQIDPCSRRREVATGVLRSSPKPDKMSCFLPWERDRDFLSVVFYTPAAKCFCTRHLVGRVVNTVTRGWIGAPNERAPFRIHDAVVGFDWWLPRTRNLAALNQAFGWVFSSRSWPKIWPGIFTFHFFFFFFFLFPFFSPFPPPPFCSIIFPFFPALSFLVSIYVRSFFFFT